MTTRSTESVDSCVTSGDKVATNADFMVRYLAAAPLPLALERILECRIHRQHQFVRPVLDVGCGEGLLASVLFADPIDTGIDPDADELRQAGALGAYRELIRCRGDAVPKASGSFRTVLSNSVLEHIPDLEPVFREVHRLLADDGHFYVTVPSARFDQYTVVNQLLMKIGLTRAAARFRRFFNAFWRHYHFHSPEEWKALAERHGFVVVECYAFNSKRICLTNDMLVPASVLSFLSKKLTNRWVMLPALRHAVVKRFSPIAMKLLKGGEEPGDGGLVYLNLKKSGVR